MKQTSRSQDRIIIVRKLCLTQKMHKSHSLVEHVESSNRLVYPMLTGLDEGPIHTMTELRTGNDNQERSQAVRLVIEDSKLSELYFESGLAVVRALVT